MEPHESRTNESRAGEVKFGEETVLRAKQVIARYPEGKSRSALLPLLHLVQAEEGYVSAGGIAFCAQTLGLTRAEVAAVATFYTMYKRRPAGDWLVSVCTNTMCDVLGGGAVYQALSEQLGAGNDETVPDATVPDGTITLEHAECLAACDYGPVLTVNYEFFDRVDVESAKAIVAELQRGGRPTPSRGARLCPLREVSMHLAGFPDERAEAIADGVAGDPSLRGTQLALEHFVGAPPYDPQTPIVPPPPTPDPSPATPSGATPSPAAPSPAAPSPAAPSAAGPSGADANPGEVKP